MNSVHQLLFTLPARRPVWLLILLVLVTGWLASALPDLKLQPAFLNQLPEKHPFAEVYNRYDPLFGGGNRMVIALHQPDGDIYTAEFFNALAGLTEDVLKISGVNPATVRSLFTGNVTYREVTEFGYDGSRVVPKAYNGSSAQIEQIRANVDRSREIGRSVALDQSGALVSFELVEADAQSGQRLDYAELGATLEQIRHRYQQDGFQVRMTGFAPFVLALMSATNQVLLLMAVSLLLLLGAISWQLRSVPAAVAIVAAVTMGITWQLGLVALAGIALDPLSMLVPGLLFLFAATLALLLYRHWRADSSALSDDAVQQQQACSSLFAGGVAPVTVTLLLVAAILALSRNSDVPLIRQFVELGLIGLASLWAALLIGLPTLLVLLAKPQPLVEETATSTGSWTIRRTTVWVSLLLALVVGVLCRQLLTTGDPAASAASQLAADSRYNRETLALQQDYRFGVDQLTIVAESTRDGCLEFDVLHTIDRLIWQLRDLPEVRMVYGLPVYMKLSSIGHHEGFLRFFGYAREARGNSVNTWGTELRDKLYDQTCSTMPIRIFPVNHGGQTLRRIVEVAERFIAQQNNDRLQFRLAIGNAAIRVAANDRVSVLESGFLITALLAGMVVVGFATFNLARGLLLLVMVPLAASGIYLALLLAGQGLTVTTLPTVALLLGWGCVPLLSAIFNRSAQFQALLRSGSMALLVPAVALLPWLFSPLQYQVTTGLVTLLALVAFVVISRYLLPRWWHAVR